MFSQLIAWWDGMTVYKLIWIAFGLAAQSMFFMRFVVQWIASERVRRSIVPETFWYFSFVGGAMLLVYATVYLGDPVIMLGQAMGLVIYTRNIYFIWREKRAAPAGGDPAQMGAAAE